MLQRQNLYMNPIEDADIPEDQKVNIVTIMLESYNDFSKFDLDFNVDVYGPFESIKENAYSGELVTNIFGGGTIDTERAFLTGIKDLPSFKSSNKFICVVFENQGYYTEAMHPCYGWFYDRRNIDTYLGFDNFYYLENYYGESFLTKLFLKMLLIITKNMYLQAVNLILVSQ